MPETRFAQGNCDSVTHGIEDANTFIAWACFPCKKVQPIDETDEVNCPECGHPREKRNFALSGCPRFPEYKDMGPAE